MKRRNRKHGLLAALWLIGLLAAGYGSIAPAEEVRDEAQLITVLQSDADWAEKQAACRTLREIGTAKSVPALAALLPDERLSHWARFALEPMSYPEAGQALRDTLDKAKGLPKAGVIISLGARRDASAVPKLVPLLKSRDVNVARAAAGALGRIATPEAVKGLIAIQKTAPEALRLAVAEGLLAAAQQLTQDGQGGAAASIYENLFAPTWPMHIRSGAFRGLAYAEPEKAPERLIAALEGTEPLFRDMAAQIIAETSGAEATARYAAALPNLSAGGQVALMRGLGERKDPAARPAMLQALGSPDKPVKLATIKALGGAGGAMEVPPLIGLLGAEDKEIAAAAQAALITMRSDGVNPAIIAVIPEVSPPIRAQLLALMVNRKAAETASLASRYLSDGDIAVRISALRALVQTGGAGEAIPVLEAVRKTSDDAELSAAEEALIAIVARTGEAVLPVILAAMDDAKPEARIVLLRGAARTGTRTALKTVLAAMKDPNDDISGEAVRLLSDWPALGAAPHLRKLLDSKDLRRQVLGLRGYVRLAQLEPSIKKKARMLDKATRHAKRPEEKKLVAAAWGTLSTKRSCNVLLRLMDDEAVRDEAASALIPVALGLAKEDKVLSCDALKAVLDKCTSSGISESAQKALDSLRN